MEYCRTLASPYSEWEKNGVFLPCVESKCRYKSPARFDDLLTIRTEIISCTNISIVFSYKVYNGAGKLLAEGSTKHAFCGADGRIRARPEPFWSRLYELALEGNQ